MKTNKLKQRRICSGSPRWLSKPKKCTVSLESLVAPGPQETHVLSLRGLPDTGTDAEWAAADAELKAGGEDGAGNGSLEAFT